MQISRRLSKATSLEEFYLTLSPEPLTGESEMKAYYVSEIQDLRRKDNIALMRLNLNRRLRGRRYKALLMGHRGCGKSTELTRLADSLDDYSVLRLDMRDELDPENFQPFDVLLVLLLTLLERTACPKEKGGAGKQPGEESLRKIWDWFATEEEVQTKAKELAGSASAEADTASSLWGKIIGLRLALKGEMKYASARKSQVTDYRLRRLSELMEPANALLDECNNILYETTQKEWLIILDCFDKSEDFPLSSIEKLFVKHRSVFVNLRTHLIATIPIELGYSSKSLHLPAPKGNVFCIQDIPVFTKDKRPSDEGRAALRRVLDARVDLALFEEGQVDRLVVASGGNIRDLFTMTCTAADLATLKGNKIIEKDEVDLGIAEMRKDYEHWLGENIYEEPPVSFSDKAERLKKLYDGEPDAEVPDSVLYSLLRSRLVQEFNGEGWFGVHPLVVDMLVSLGEITKPAEGSVPGGTIE